MLSGGAQLIDGAQLEHRFLRGEDGACVEHRAFREAQGRQRIAVRG